MRTEAALQEMEHAIQALQKEHGETENTEETLPVTRVLLLHYPPSTKTTPHQALQTSWSAIM